MKEEIFRAHNIEMSDEKGAGLSGFDISLYRGEVLGIHGNRYAGRNKLFHLISGDILPDDGNALFYGKKQDSQDERPVVFWFDKNTKMIKEFTIWENIAMIRRNQKGYRMTSQNKLKRMIALLFDDYDIPYDIESKVQVLSLMEQLLVEIMVAKFCKAEIVLIDFMDFEGTSDEYGQLRSMVKKMKMEGMTFVFFSPQAMILSLFVDRIAFLYNGRIIKYLEDVSDKKRMNQILKALYREEKAIEKPPASDLEEVFSISDLEIDGEKKISFSLYKGEYTTIVTPYLEIFYALHARLSRGEQSNTCLVKYQGKQRTVLKRKDGVYFLNTAFLDQVVEEMSPFDNLCMGLYERMSVLGVERKRAIACVKQEFYEWYAHEGILEQKDCKGLYRKDKIALKLFQLKLSGAKIIICNDFAIHNDIITMQMVKKCLVELLERGTAICMITSDSDYSDEMVNQYITI